MNKLVNNLLYTGFGVAMFFLFTSGYTIFFNWVVLVWLIAIVTDMD